MKRKLTNYHPLHHYLADHGSQRVALSFADIERILGCSLPPSALKYPQPFWANTRTHSYSWSWLDAGWKTESVNRSSDTVTFVRVA